MTTPRLSHADMELLAFERTPWKFPAAKAEAIRQRFGVTATRYYQVMNDLIDRPAAEVYDPELVRRLRSLREARAAVAGRKRERL